MPRWLTPNMYVLRAPALNTAGTGSDLLSLAHMVTVGRPRARVVRRLPPGLGYLSHDASSGSW